MTTYRAATLRDGIHRHLQEHGPATAEEIHAALYASGVTSNPSSSSVRSSLSSSKFCFQHPDKRWDLTSRALTGVVLTVRPRSRLRTNVLWAHADLEPFDQLLVDGSVPLLTGGCATPGSGKIRTLIGPEGWLPDVPPDGLIGLRWTGSLLDVFAVDNPVESSPKALASLRLLFSQHHLSLRTTSSYYPYDEKEVLFSSVLISALREVPELFASPQLPLSEIYAMKPAILKDPTVYEDERTTTLTLDVPRRVHEELVRRAQLLGERLEDHAAVLLGGASDRVVVDRDTQSDLYRYERQGDDSFPPENDRVVRPLRILS